MSIKFNVYQHVPVETPSNKISKFMVGAKEAMTMDVPAHRHPTMDTFRQPNLLVAPAATGAKHRIKCKT